MTTTSDTSFPVSFSEELLWRQEHGDTAAFTDCPRHLSVAARICGSLDEELLVDAITAIVDRHEALRSQFSARCDRLYRRIAPRGRVQLVRRDVKHGSSADVDSELREHINLPFDLESGPLYSATLLRRGSSEHVFCFTAHHIVTDAWSNRLFCNELNAIYASLGSTSTVAVPPLALTYRDYVTFQSAPYGQPLTDLVARCVDRLDGAPSAITWPPDRTAPSTLDPDRSSVRSLSLTREHSDALHAFARVTGVTLATACLAMFTIVLFSATGVDDVVIGLPIVDRPRPDFESVIGLFTNVLIVRTRLAGNPTVVDVCQRVKASIAEAIRDRHLPYGYWLRSRPPAFRTLFNCVNVPVTRLRLPGTVTEELRVTGDQRARASLGLHIHTRNDVLTLKVLYDASLFSASNIDTFIRCLVAVIDASITDNRLTLAAAASALSKIRSAHTHTDTSADQPHLPI